MVVISMLIVQMHYYINSSNNLFNQGIEIIIYHSYYSIAHPSN